jgi:hypothetical protein
MISVFNRRRQKRWQSFSSPSSKTTKLAILFFVFGEDEKIFVIFLCWRRKSLHFQQILFVIFVFFDPRPTPIIPTASDSDFLEVEAAQKLPLSEAMSNVF